MYSFVSGFDSLYLKSQVREEIFSLLGNCGKTIISSAKRRKGTTMGLLNFWETTIKNTLKKGWYNPYKKLIWYGLLLFFGTIVSPPETSFARAEEKTFIVTAYYSPLPDQTSYARWNYEADKRLNGNGTNGASGTPVFTGMIAAPKTYAFGTHIFFPGLGLGRVEDRGWAIVDAWVRGQPHDRIDIWMGYGDAWLRRARTWWVREVKWIIIDDITNLNQMDLEWIDIGRVNLGDFPTAKAQSQWGISSDIIEAFANLGYIVEWGDVKNMIFTFQKDQWIVVSLDEAGAGNFGPKTKTAFIDAYKKYSVLRSADIEAIEKAKKELLDERASWETRYSQAHTHITQIGFPKMGDKWSNIISLQKLLRQEWFFKGKNTGVMVGTTVVALKKYQKSRGIAPSGMLDSVTKDALISDALEA
jgi:hypothetical protein